MAGGILDIARRYFETPLGREIARSLRPTPALPPGAPGGDILDPSDPGYSRRHGGTIPTGLIGGIEQLTTLPGRVARGEVNPMSDEGIAAAAEAAGGLTLGAAGSVAPAGALRAGAARSAAPKVFPEYASQYPPVPPAALQVDKKTGKEFLGKGESPETKAFMKERARVRKEMQGGYTPYFDPAQRTDVDPSNYPTDVRTLTDVVGAKPETRARHEAVSMSPESLTRLRDAYEGGVKLGGGENWYHMGQLEKAFIDELGPEEGRKAFRDKFAGSMAATTGGADPESNFLAAMYANYQRQRGEPAATRGYELPVPIGGRFISNNMEQANKYAETGAEAFTAANPKRHDFQFNFLGHPDKATIDEQMSNLIQPGMQIPPSGNYGSYEAAVHKLAGEYGVDPRYFQEVAWAGGKAAKDPTYKPHPMIETVNRSIERTARLTGKTPAEVVRRGIVRSEMPMYAGGVPLPLAYKPEEER